MNIHYFPSIVRVFVVALIIIALKISSTKNYAQLGSKFRRMVSFFITLKKKIRENLAENLQLIYVIHESTSFLWSLKSG